MPGTNKIGNSYPSNPSKNITTVDQKSNAQKISENKLTSLAKHIDVKQTKSELSDETFLINESVLISKYVEQIIAQASSTTDNIKRMFALILSQINELDATESKKLNEFLSVLPTDEKQLAELMVSQRKSSTIFNGKLFDILRTWENKYSDNPMIKSAIAEVLQNYDAHINDKASVESIINNLCKLTRSTILKSQGPPIKEILENFENIYNNKFNMKITPESTEEMLLYLKKNVIPDLKLALAQNQTNYFARSFLMMVVHHTIRLENSDINTLTNSLSDLMLLLENYENITEEFKNTMSNMLNESIQQNKNNPRNDLTNKLLDMISENAKSQNLQPSSIAAENALNSILANQSTIIPLLNFVIPFNFGNLMAFSQMWVDPDAKKQKSDKGTEISKHGIKIFCNIDIEHMGTFEVTLFIGDDNKIDCKIGCPIHIVEYFNNIKTKINSVAHDHGFALEKCEIGSLTKESRLNDIFPQINKRRRFINVKI